MNDNPPTGVIAPSHVYLGNNMAFAIVIPYSDPQNKMIPVIKDIPAHFTNLLLNSLKIIAVNNNAKTW